MITQDRYDKFVRQFENSQRFSGRRFGQAFYDHFDLGQFVGLAVADANYIYNYGRAKVEARIAKVFGLRVRELAHQQKESDSE